MSVLAHMTTEVPANVSADLNHTTKWQLTDSPILRYNWTTHKRTTTKGRPTKQQLQGSTRPRRSGTTHKWTGTPGRPTKPQLQATSKAK